MILDNGEVATLCDVSADHGRTWTTQWLTPTEVLQHRINGYVTRRHSRDKTIRVFVGKTDPHMILITLGVPYLCDPNEYVNAYLDAMLDSNFRETCEWEFA